MASKNIIVTRGMKLLSFSLLTFLLNSNLCLGETLKFEGSSSIACVKQSFTFTCTVLDAVTSNYQIKFYKANVAGTFSLLIQNSGTCQVFNPPKIGYTAECGAGTDVSSSTVKKYTLQILSASVSEDATEWWCYIDNPAKNSSKIALEVLEPKPSDEAVGLASVVGILIICGIILLVILVVKKFDTNRTKILTICLAVGGGILLILATVTAILIGTQKTCDQNDPQWIAVVVLCAFGFVFGIVFVGFAVWKIKATAGKLDSKSDAENTAELRSETNANKPSK